MDNQAVFENTSDTSSDQDADAADGQVMPDTTFDFATEHDIDAPIFSAVTCRRLDCENMYGQI